MKKGEGNAMKKDIEWLKREIPNLRGYAVVIDGIDGGLNPVTTISLKDVYRLINQLDEPEVTHEQVVEWIENNEFYCHATAETVLENAVDKGELGYYGTKYSVVKKPVIPKFVAEFIEDRKHVFVNTLQWVFHRAMENRESDWFKEEYEWVKHNSETFARAWLDGYKVEEEQKYFVSSRESAGFWFLSKNNDNEVVIGTNKDYYDRRWESLKLTEQEIKDYDARYWPFAKPVG